MYGHNMRAWRHSTIKRPPDNIVSSEYTYDKIKPLIVKTNDKEEVNMFDLLSMEYGRRWLSEREDLSQVILRPIDDDFLVRRYVIRGLLMKKKSWEKKSYFKMKRFENIPPKIVIKRPNVEQLRKEFTEEEKRQILEEARAQLSFKRKDKPVKANK